MSSDSLITVDRAKSWWYSGFQKQREYRSVRCSTISRTDCRSTTSWSHSRQLTARQATAVLRYGQERIEQECAARDLLDESVPVQLERAYRSRRVYRVQIGWRGIRNGELLDRSETEAFDLVIVADKTCAISRT